MDGVSPIKYISQASVCLLGHRGESLQERRSEVKKGVRVNDMDLAFAGAIRTKAVDRLIVPRE